MATTTYGTPYVSGTDLVANWPAASLTVANSIDAAGYYVGRGINAQTASYTGVLTDAGKTVTMTNASANTFTVPANASVAYPTGTRINILNLGAGACTPTAGAGVTISGTITALATNGSASVIKTATNTWSYIPSGAGAGLTFIASASPSGASTVSFTSQFSATYDNYRIIGRLTGGSTTALNYRMRTAVPADDTTANYSWQRINASTSTVGAARSTGSTASEIAVIATATGYFVIDIIAPNLAQPTALLAQSFDTVTAPNLYQYTSAHNVSTAFPGITLFPSAGTVAGYVALYGYALT